MESKYSQRGFKELGIYLNLLNDTLFDVFYSSVGKRLLTLIEG